MSKRPMLLKAADVCMKADDNRPKATDVFVVSDRCPLGIKAADVEKFFVEIFGRKRPMYPKYESGRWTLSM